jgi:alcohol dehydrogenase class IV
VTGVAERSPAGRLEVREFVHQPSAARVVFGLGARHRLPEELARLGLHRVLFIGGAEPLQGEAEELVDALGDSVVARIIEIAQHVPAAGADAAVEVAAEAGVDGVVALGGGSATGLAKAVALRTTLPVVAVPTTYAGSEMTDIWGRTENGEKVTGRDPRVRPKTVVYDVELTVGMPAGLTGTSGLNALAHCVEAAYDTQASPITRLLAVEGARALAAALPAVVDNGHDLAARSETLYGAWLAGIALGSARMAVHHRVCHILGGTFGLPHAETHACLLPYAVAFNQEAAQDALGKIQLALATTTSSAAALWDIGRRVGAPRSLAELGLTRDEGLQAAVILASHPVNNPRPLDPDGARALLLAAYEGLRPAAEA